MVLEATMICVDNSEWMCKGDYSPTRFQAQADDATNPHNLITTTIALFPGDMSGLSPATCRWGKLSPATYRWGILAEEAS
ncbi:26S proteasome non-ATPase regulatory subunit 4 [Tanacetum coccineum]